jgi:hypothetical protein
VTLVLFPNKLSWQLASPAHEASRQHVEHNGRLFYLEQLP